MSQSSDVSWKWVAIGAMVIIGLNQLLQELLAAPVGGTLYESMGVPGLYLYVALIAFGSFFVGGLIVGWWSPGETIKEPAFAALAGVLVNAGFNLRNVDGEAMTMMDWAIGSAIMAVIGFLFGMGGGWTGERLQGDTTDKMRERGELPR
jgi:hypothetical protein